MNHFALTRKMKWKLRFILSHVGKCQSWRALFYFLGQQLPRRAALWENVSAESDFIQQPTARQDALQLCSLCVIPEEVSLTWYTHAVKWAASGNNTYVPTVERDLQQCQLANADCPQSEHNEGCPRTIKSLPSPQKKPSLLHAFLCAVIQLIFLISAINKPLVYHNTCVFFFTYHS